MHPAFSYSCITLDKIRDMAKKKHKGHYCKICGEYKSNESFSGKGHVQHICKECMGEMKKSNKKILDLPFGDNEFEIVDADEYIDTILYGNNEERENKTFKKLSREQKMVLKAIVQDWLTRIGMAWGNQKQAALWSIVSPFLILFLGTNTLQKWQVEPSASVRQCSSFSRLEPRSWLTFHRW